MNIEEEYRRAQAIVARQDAYTTFILSLLQAGATLKATEDGFEINGHPVKVQLQGDTDIYEILVLGSKEGTHLDMVANVSAAHPVKSVVLNIIARIRVVQAQDKATAA